MIPETIHYCWFSGDKKPENIQHCIDSWSAVMPDYTIKCWGPDSFDFDSVPFVKEAYSKRKWAFMADYVRLYALYTEGGIYLDSDVQVFRKFDDFLKYRFFIGSELGDMENRDDVCVDGAIFGSEAGHPFLKRCLEHYDNLHFILPDGSLNNITQPRVISKIAEEFGYRHTDQNISLQEGMQVLDTTHFTHICDPSCLSNSKLYALHLLNHSWIDVKAGYSFCRRHHISWLHPVLFPLFRMLEVLRHRKKY